MSEEIESLVIATLCRVLQLDPDLDASEAAVRVQALLDLQLLPESTAYIAELRGRLRRQGVPNPAWLASYGVRQHIFMATSRPGHLSQLVRMNDEYQTEVSQYIIYGDWDTIVILNGSDTEALRVREALQSGANEPPVYFPGTLLISHGYRVQESFTEVEPDVNDSLIDLAVDYDREDLRTLRASMERANVFLGPHWTLNGSSPYSVTAFIGITLRGRVNMTGTEFVSLVTSDKLIRDALVDLYEVEQGRPFHFFAKFGCRTMSELDLVTTQIGSLGNSSLRVEGITYVVANGRDAIALPRTTGRNVGVAIGVDLSQLLGVAEEAIASLPPEIRESFGELNEVKQLSVVKSIVELQQTLESAEVGAEIGGRFRTAISAFLRECANSAESPNLTGAIAESVTAVEGIVKRLLSKLAYAALGRDPGLIQAELKLPTRTISKLTMGKVVTALRIASVHPAFDAYKSILDERMIDRLSWLADQRNEWLHDVDTETYGDLVEDARRVMVGAIEIANWAESAFSTISGGSEGDSGSSEGDALEPVRLMAEGERASGPRIFVSHATADGDSAERISMALKAFGIDAWYAEWELNPGDSIVEKISAAIARSDILMVLLSPQSVTSRWVQRELNSALAAQLAGEKVIVLPVVIEPCDVPTLLREILYVDLSRDFGGGLLQLIEFLRSRPGSRD